jgi:hypothetical protein
VGMFLLIGVGFGSLRFLLKKSVEGAISAFGDQTVLVDPRGQSLEGGRVEVDGLALRVSGLGDQTSLFEHMDVFGDCLLGDSEGLSELVERRVRAGQAGDDSAANGICKGHEGPVKLVLVNLHFDKPVG